MTKTKNVDLVALFKKEEKNKKYLLISSVVFLVASVLPWFSFGLGITISGWMGILFLANFAALAILLFWVVSNLGILLGGLEKTPKMVNKVLASFILGSVIIFIINSSFSFSAFGIGFYLGLISAGVAVFFAFELKIEDIKKKLDNLKKDKKNN